MRKSVWGAVIGVGLLAGVSQARAQALPAPGPAEAAAASKIQSHLQNDADLKNNQIDVRVEAGVAVLTGKVDSEGEKAKAAKLARVADIDIVDNRLDVGSASVGNAISDSAVTTKVKSQLLANTTLRQADISVTTNNGVVTLSGQVPSEDVHQLALGVTRSTGGVNRVEDQLKVTATR
jgi:hyperosmotically inducible periplasmic protein